MPKNSLKIRIITKGQSETVWATHTKGNQYRLDNSPFFAYGISWEDIVEAIPDESGFLTLQKLIKKSGNRTIRVADPKKTLPSKLFKDIEKLGCSIEGANSKYICVNIPSNTRIGDLVNYLSINNYIWEHADPTY